MRVDIDRSKLTWRHHARLKVCLWLLDRLERWSHDDGPMETCVACGFSETGHQPPYAGEA